MLFRSSQLSTHYSLLADELVRAGEPDQAVVVLRRAVTIWPEDDLLRRRLALAHAAQGQFQQALVQIEPYLERHQNDHQALLIALHAIYGAHAGGQTLTTPEGDLERMTAYARSYAAAAGPHGAIVADWTSTVTAVP